MDREDRNGQKQLTGRRIRRRRLFMDKTQGALAKSLGISYQQLQKYETGAAMVPEERLAEIAHLLGVPLSYFSAEGFPAAAGRADAREAFAESAEGVALIGAVAGIPDAARARLMLAIAAYCDSHAALAGPDAAALTNWLARMSAKDSGAEVGEAAEASVRDAKVELARLLGKTIRVSRMTQLFTAEILSSDQGKISAIARGDVRGVSLEKLLRFLLMLGWDVGIHLTRRPAEQDGGARTVIPDAQFRPGRP